MYLLIDPPVTAYSPPDQIVAWIAKLEHLASRPEYAEKGPRKQIRSAIVQARGWLRTSKRLDSMESARTREALRHPPA
jgi:hypothetical protein